MYLKTMNVKRQAQFRQWSRKPYAVFNSLKMLIKISVLSVAYILVNPAQECKAQTDSTVTNKNIELEEVEVTGQRAPVIASQVARVVTVITRKEVEQAPAQNVNELLENVPQVDIRQRGVNGVQADISIQGGSFDQTLILLNGINLSDPQTGHHNLNLPIGLSAIDRIEVLKGPASRVFGPNAFAGAVNFITGENPENFVKATANGGAYGFYNGNISVNQHSKIFHNYIDVSKSGCDGYITNTDYDMLNVFYHGKVLLNKNNVGIQLGYSDKDFGANSFYSPKLPNQFESNQTYFGAISGSLGTKLKFTPNLYWRRNYDKFIYDRTNPLSAGNYHYTDVYGSNFNVTYSGVFGKSTFGADFRKEIIFSSSLGKSLSVDEVKNVPGDSGKYYKYGDWRNNISFFIEQSAVIDKLSVSAGFMINKNTELDDIDIFPGMDVSYRIYDNTKVFFTTNRSLRLPTFTNLYYNSKPQKILGDVNLKPETAWIVETGLQTTIDMVTMNVSYFHKWGKQTIDYIWRDTVWHAENVTELNTDGVEAGINYIPANDGFIKKLSISYSLTLQSKASGDYQSLYVLDQLKHKLTTTVSHRIYKNLSAYWQASIQERSGYYDLWNPVAKTSSVTTYDPILLFDGRIVWNYSLLKVFVEGSNLLDQDYVDIGNINQPGIWLKAGFEIKLKY
jgi:vitamin B12 transporter